MNTAQSKLIIILLIALVFLAGFFIAKSTFQEKPLKEKDDSVIILEQLKAVSKLITVEAFYNELYTHQDYTQFDWFPFQKKAILRVKAKVSAGYDLSGIQYDVNKEAKVITISHLPKPQILSIDHSLDYYDITEGIFNNFEKDDYNKLQAKAKDLIYQKAMEGLLLVEAAKKGIATIEVMKTIATQAGWKVEVRR